MAKTESTTAPASTAAAVKTPAAKKRVAAPAAARKTPAKRAPVAKKVAAKPALAAKKVAKPAAPAVKPAAAPAALADAKNAKEKKHKLVRDSITVPKAEYQVLEAMKHRAAQLKVMVKKTELIRAGMKHLATLPDAVFLEAIAAVPSLKTGRPAKS
jgi:hypothetical protein